VSFAAITLCTASQRGFTVDVVYFVISESGNFWILPRIAEQFPLSAITSVFKLNSLLHNCINNAKLRINFRRCIMKICFLKIRRTQKQVNVFMLRNRGSQLAN
jgi:hypothetical protein